MWKYLAALLVVLLSLGGFGLSCVAATTVPSECTDCYANIITQTDSQTIQNVRVGAEATTDALGNKITNPIATVAVGNEGLSAAIIVTKPPVQPAAGAMFALAPFARIDQSMSQTLSNIGPSNPTIGEGAKGITWNKAIQAAWIANQGVKELETNDMGAPIYVKEGSYISQTTNQITNNVYDYALRENAKVLNVDNKLAMIVDDMKAILNLQASANSAATDSQSSDGTINNNVDVNVGGTVT